MNIRQFLWVAGAVPLMGQAPLSLSDAVQMGLRQHPAVEASAATTQAAQSRVREAESGYLPKLGYSESIQRSDNPVFVFGSLLNQRQFTQSNFNLGLLNNPNFVNNFQSQVRADQTLYDFGATNWQVRSAKLGTEIASEDERRTRMGVIAEIAGAYFGAVLAKQRLVVAENAVRSAEADLERAQNVRGAGLSTDADVLSVRVHRADMKEREIQARAALDVAEAALNDALGLPLETQHDLSTALTSAKLSNTDLAALDKTSLHGPVPREALLATEAAQAQTSAARTALLPKISAHGVFEADRQTFATRGGANWFFGVSLDWTFFNGFASEARRDEAEHLAGRRGRSKSASSRLRGWRCKRPTPIGEARGNRSTWRLPPWRRPKRACGLRATATKRDSPRSPSCCATKPRRSKPRQEIWKRSITSAWRPLSLSWPRARWREIPMRLSKPFFVLAVVLLGLTACREAPRKAEASVSPQAVTVPVVAAASVDLPSYYEAVGTVRARTSAVIASKIMGTVQDVRVRTGEAVGAGQLLVTIDSRDLDVAVRQAQAARQEALGAQGETDHAVAAAQANLDLANVTFRRMQELYDKKSISDQERDESLARVKAAQAAYDMAVAKRAQVSAKIQQASEAVSSAEVMRGYAEIHAPFGGIVTEKPVESGSMAMPGAPLLTVEQSGALRLEVPVDESFLPSVRAGDTVRVALDSLDRALDARVSEIGPLVDPASRAFLVKIDLPSLPHLRAGLFGRAKFLHGTREAVVIPAAAVAEQGQMQSVVVVEGGSARTRLVTLGQKQGDMVEILSGLNAGERVVSPRSTTLADGARVEPKP